MTDETFPQSDDIPDVQPVEQPNAVPDVLPVPSSDAPESAFVSSRSRPRSRTEKTGVAEDSPDSSRAGRRTKVSRDLAMAAYFLIGAVLCAAIAVGGLLLVHHWLILLLSVPMGLLAIGITVGMFAASSKADCPACGSAIENLARRRNKPRVCPTCRRFVEGEDGYLWAIEESRIASRPVFCAQLSEGFVFPDVCCVCGRPATRYETISAKVVHGISLVTMAGGRVITNKVTVRGVPHCNRHRDGAKVDEDNANHILFRSYPYLRAFCTQNGIEPGPAKGLIDRILEENKNEGNSKTNG